MKKLSLILCLIAPVCFGQVEDVRITADGTVINTKTVKFGTGKLMVNGVEVVGGGITSVSGTAPIVSSGGTTPAISIVPATGSIPGSMSATDKAKLDGIAPGAQAGTVTSVAVSGANGIGISGSPITLSGTIALSLGAITPTSVLASGTVAGSNLTGTNTGDQVVPANTTATASQWFTAYNSTTGAFTKAQPAFSDLSGSATTGQLPSGATLDTEWDTAAEINAATTDNDFSITTHTHTTTTVSGLDISDDTNLAGTANEITLTGDTLSAHSALTRDTEWDTAAEINAATTDNDFSLTTHTHTFASLTSLPTTIAGYGITDFNSLGDARWSLLAHTHTTTTISGLDISDDTNLAGTASEITLTGDTLSLHSAVTRDTEWDTTTEINAATTDTDFVTHARTISTTTPLAGGGDLSANRTLTIADAAADGSTKGASTFTAADFNASSGNISLDYTNGQAASGSNKGFLTSADWTTFNAKAPTANPTFTGTANFEKIALPANTSDSVLKVGGLEFQNYNPNNTWFGDNTYFNGTNMKYRATGFAGYLRWFSGQSSLHNFPSGSAGASLTNESNTQLKAYQDGTVALGGSIPITIGDYSAATLVVYPSGAVRYKAVAFSAAQSSPGAGTCQWFTDSSTAIWGATITGGGANNVLGCYNGTNWTVTAK